MSAGSVSRLDCSATIRGKGTANVSLYRHLAPLTIDAVAGTLPLESRVNVQRSMVCLFTSIRTGVEKPRKSFERGEIAFLPSGGLLCFILGPVKSEMPLNPVGKVETGIELFDSVRPGDVVLLKAASP